MDDESDPKSGPTGWIILVAAAPLLYILSIGPVGALTKNKPTSTVNMVRKVYYPVIWLHDHTPLKGPIEAYANLWGFH
jgi:hypothetical protein